MPILDMTKIENLKDAEPKGDELGYDTTLWVLYYRHGNDPKKEKVFEFAGTLLEARYRAEQHCKLMGFTLNYVRPFISDLDRDEEFYRKRNGG